jgi:hypothetical protein
MNMNALSRTTPPAMIVRIHLTDGSDESFFQESDSTNGCNKTRGSL